MIGPTFFGNRDKAKTKTKASEKRKSQISHLGQSFLMEKMVVFLLCLTTEARIESWKVLPKQASNGNGRQSSSNSQHISPMCQALKWACMFNGSRWKLRRLQKALFNFSIPSITPDIRGNCCTNFAFCVCGIKEKKQTRNGDSSLFFSRSISVFIRTFLDVNMPTFSPFHFAAQLSK